MVAFLLSQSFAPPLAPLLAMAFAVGVRRTTAPPRQDPVLRGPRNVLHGGWDALRLHSAGQQGHALRSGRRLQGLVAAG